MGFTYVVAACSLAVLGAVVVTVYAIGSSLSPAMRAVFLGSVVVVGIPMLAIDVYWYTNDSIY